MVVAAKNIGMKQGSKYIVKDIDWQIKQGEKWVLFGLNGCGKTTLLSILSGYKGATHGELTLFGQKIDGENMVEARKRVGWVSSSFFDRYYNQEIVLDIALSGKFGTLGIDGDVAAQDVIKVKRLMALLGLKGKDRYPYDLLSKGEKQRVLIVRALMSEPEILILDEPCAGLDIFAKAQFLNMIEKMVEQESMTIVYVTHHTDEILPFFDKAALMKNGVLHSQGDIKAVFEAKNLTDFFAVKTEVVWTKRNFYLELDLGETAAVSKKSFI